MIGDLMSNGGRLCCSAGLGGGQRGNGQGMYVTLHHIVQRIIHEPVSGDPWLAFEARGYET